MITFSDIVMWLLLLVILVAAIPVFVFSIQVIASVFYRKPLTEGSVKKKPVIAVLVPAHNEEQVIAQTLSSLKGLKKNGHTLVVVADNCNDCTSEIAAEFNADVIERRQDSLLGKGYALDFGMTYLKSLEHKPDIVVFLDADCEISAKGLDALSIYCHEINRPVQALYLMKTVQGAGIRQKIAEFAWLVKNQARPLGYKVLGLPCQLMGTGMAFPWRVISDVNLANASIVEDLKLGLDLAERGDYVDFYPDVSVHSTFPDSEHSELTQRTRWEHGHIGMLSLVPGLLKTAIIRRNAPLATLALDLSVPPLALLVLGLTVFWGMALLFWLITGLQSPFLMISLLLVVLGISVLLAWYRYARDIIALSDLFHAPVYVLKKVPVYLKFIFARERKWIRTSRK